MWKNEFVMAVRRQAFEQAQEVLDYRLGLSDRKEALQEAMESVLKDKPFWAQAYFAQGSKARFLFQQGAVLAGNEKALIKTENPLLVEIGLQYAKETRTPLCKAVFAGKNIKMAEKLVACWGDVTIPDADGHDLLHYANLSGDEEIIQMVSKKKQEREAFQSGIASFRRWYVPKPKR